MYPARAMSPGMTPRLSTALTQLPAHLIHLDSTALLLLCVFRTRVRSACPPLLIIAPELTPSPPHSLVPLPPICTSSPPICTSLPA